MIDKVCSGQGLNQKENNGKLFDNKGQDWIRKERLN